MLTVSAADAADSPRDPMAVLNSLLDRIYVLGETSGNAAEMAAAEEKAAMKSASMWQLVRPTAFLQKRRASNPLSRQPPTWGTQTLLQPCSHPDL
jgi:hypothetical protein